MEFLRARRILIKRARMPCARRRRKANRGQQNDAQDLSRGIAAGVRVAQNPVAQGLGASLRNAGADISFASIWYAKCFLVDIPGHEPDDS